MRRLPWLTATIATMLILIEWHGWLATEGLSLDSYHTYLTSAILHTGWSHCIINTTLLVLLGTFLEGFGHRRTFAILMALAALTTPIASVIVLGEAVPDGARGFSGVAAALITFYPYAVLTMLPRRFLIIGVALSLALLAPFALDFANTGGWGPTVHLMGALTGTGFAAVLAGNRISKFI